MGTSNLDPVEIGKKLKLARQTKGLSQEKLAELAQTSCQNISKFENKGLSDINWIKTFSELLEVNLIGEIETKQIEMSPIGKEIISFLIKEYGYCEYSYLLREIRIDDNTIKKEIESLCFNDWVKREVYDGWYGYKEDKLFLTNLGLVVYENSNINSMKAEELSECRDEGIARYDFIIDELNFAYRWENNGNCFGDFQEFVNGAKYEKLTRNIYSINVGEGHRRFVRDESCLYLVNYIYYLKGVNEPDYSRDIVGKDYEIINGNEDGLPYIGMYYPYDSFGEFTSSVDDDEEPLFYYIDSDLITTIDCQADIEYRMKYGITNDVLLDFDERNRILQNIQNKNGEDKTFTIDEYKEFINKYFRMPENDYEQMLYQRIIELIQLNNYCNLTLDYFTFSGEWIKNGLAELIIENLGLMDYYRKYLDSDNFDGSPTVGIIELDHEFYIPEDIKEKLEKEEPKSVVEEDIPFI